ncbi:MAG: response regulator transcription factor [Candidatus Delongbacteria bacterium]|nr:response regulator transcription factor [Candidatus Delongbacteria bacterium]
MKCLAIDDEPLALKQISAYIEKTPFLELKGQCTNSFEAMNFLSENETDLIFIDINMPEMSGIELVKTLPPGTNVIFTTAYSQYAVESYKVNAIDYLLKPISYEDFLRAANKANKLITENRSKAEQNTETPEHFFVKSEGNLIKIILQDIVYIESMSEYVMIHMKGHKQIMSLMSLKKLESSLPKDKFMRVHRSFIVNLNSITAFERSRIKLDDNSIVSIGDQYKDEVKKFIDKYFL